MPEQGLVVKVEHRAQSSCAHTHLMEAFSILSSKPCAGVMREKPSDVLSQRPLMAEPPVLSVQAD